MTTEKKQSSPFRSACFTLFANTDVDTVQKLVELGQNIRAAHAFQLIACVMYIEMAPGTGRPHIQGYARTSDSHRMAWWTKALPGAHVERRKGTEQQAADYCRKGKDKPGSILICDYGTEKPEPEFNGDVTLTTIDMLVRGCKTHQIFKRFPKFYFNQARKIKDLEADIEMWNSMSVDLSEIEGLTPRTNTPQVITPPPLLEDSKSTAFGSFVPGFTPDPQIVEKHRASTPIFGASSSTGTNAPFKKPRVVNEEDDEEGETISISD